MRDSEVIYGHALKEDFSIFQQKLLAISCAIAIMLTLYVVHGGEHKHVRENQEA